MKSEEKAKLLCKQMGCRKTNLAQAIKLIEEHFTIYDSYEDWMVRVKEDEVVFILSNGGKWKYVI